MLLTIAMALNVAPHPAGAALGPSAASVLGQNGSFSTNASGNGTGGLNVPQGLAFDYRNHRMFVSDRSNHRVLVHQLDTADRLVDDQADFVLGQPDFTTTTLGLSASKMNTPAGLIVDADRNDLYVAEVGNKRILVFDIAGIVNGEAATDVLGKTNFTTSSGTRSQSITDEIRGLAFDPTTRMLYSTEPPSNRVLVWNTANLATGMNASYVIGQSSFTTTVSTPSQTVTTNPYGVEIDPETKRLYVSNSARILIFDFTTLSNTPSALYVIGQTTFSGTVPGSGPAAFSSNTALSLGSGKLFVTDSPNARVLVFNTSIASNGVSAEKVIGQPDFTSTTANSGGVSASTLSGPFAVAFNTSTLKVFVADGQNNRVLAFDPFFTGIAMQASVAPALSVTVSGRGTTCNGQSATGFETTSSPTAVNLGRLNAGVVKSAAQDIQIMSNAPGGFVLVLRTRDSVPDVLAEAGGAVIEDVGGDIYSPGPPPVAGVSGFGFTTDDPAYFPTATFARVSDESDVVMAGSTQISRCVGYSAAARANQPASGYSVAIYYTVVSKF